MKRKGNLLAVKTTFAYVIIGSSVQGQDPIENIVTSFLTAIDNSNYTVKRFWEIKEVPSEVI